MADKIQLSAFKTGATVYAVIRKQDGTVWNGSAFETYATANLGTYDIPMSEQGTASQHYAVDFPAGITTEALYGVSVFEQSGGSPAEGDVLIGTGTLNWNGTAIQGSSLSASEVWAAATRTLTQSAAAVAAVVEGSNITITRGDTISISLTGLGNIVGNTEVWFTAKRTKSRPDSDSLLQITDTTGLVILNESSSVTAGNATLTVDDATAGDITITLVASSSAALPIGDYHYDIQWQAASGAIATLTIGKFAVSEDVTRATS